MIAIHFDELAEVLRFDRTSRSERTRPEHKRTRYPP